jgi:capsule polysaccharide export protein KpsE/RkpR
VELTDLIAQLRTELEVLRAQFDLIRREIDKPEFGQLRDRITKIESLLAVIDPSGLVKKVATFEEQVAEFKKWREESDRRRWQVLLAVGVCVLTFTSNIVTNLLLYFSRKPG